MAGTERKRPGHHEHYQNFARLAPGRFSDRPLRQLVRRKKSLSSRPAANSTVDAAFLAGIVPTTTVSGVGHYSGGVENFPRFLEDWNGKTFTYNGSMV